MTTDPAQRAAAAATPDLVAAWQRDGAVCLRGLLTADELAQLRRGIDANLAAPSPRAIVASQPDDPGFFIEDFCNWQVNPDYRALACDSPLAQVAGRLMGNNTQTCILLDTCNHRGRGGGAGGAFLTNLRTRADEQLFN